jgi:4-hydroxy-tetrahydrodipicolinate synthase
MDLSGVIPPLVTPVENRSGTVAVDELRRLTEHLVEAGVHGVFTCGTTGEFTSLSRAARKEAVRAVADAAGAVPVLAGCGGTSRGEVVGLIEDADEVGADAAVVVTPYYLPGSQEGLEEFYTDVADVSPLPIVVYHIPSRTGQELAVETVGSLAEHPSIVGVKESTGDVRYLHELVRATPESFSVFQGGVINAPTVLPMGADGIVPGQANYMPTSHVEVYDACLAGDLGTATAALARINEVSRPFRDVPLIPAIKYLTRYAGFDVGPPLPPLSELRTDQKARLRTKFNEQLSPE